jgi:hypothetical protein
MSPSGTKLPISNVRSTVAIRGKADKTFSDNSPKPAHS